VLEEELIFDVRATKADDYYITITESKKFTEEDGSFHFKKHKFICTKKIFLHLPNRRNDFLCFEPQGRSYLKDIKRF
jgi:hypothetical protein